MNYLVIVMNVCSTRLWYTPVTANLFPSSCRVYELFYGDLYIGATLLFIYQAVE